MSNIPYESPTHSGAFTLSHNSEAAEAVRSRDAHHEPIRKFRGIDNQYLDELHDDTTEAINKMIPEKITYFFNDFAGVTSSDISKEEQKATAYFWNISDPPMSIYNIIEGLQMVATTAKITRASEQLIN